MNALRLGIVLFAVSAHPASAQTMQPAEGAAQLFFSRPFFAISKTIDGADVTYLGDSLTGDRDRAVLSVSPNPEAPCVFEAFFAEAFGPTPQGKPAKVQLAYASKIDLRKPREALLRKPVELKTGEPRLVLRGERLICSRAASFDDSARVAFSTRCENELTVNADEFRPEMELAFSVLRAACKW